MAFTLTRTFADYVLPIYAPIAAARHDMPNWFASAGASLVVSVAAYVLQAHAFNIPVSLAALATPFVSCLFLWVIGTLMLAGLIWVTTGRMVAVTKVWSLAVNLYVVIALGTLANAVIVCIQADVLHETDLTPYALPSLAWFTSSPRWATFFYQLNVFSVYWYCLVAVNLRLRFGALPRPAGLWTIGVATALAALSMLGPQQG